MDEDRFNMSVRKFLKMVGVTSQREIENAIHEAVKAGDLRGDETVRAKVTLTIEAVGLKHEVEDQIELG
jgi:ribosomal protein L1